jgi:hypothetical protein
MAKLIVCDDRRDKVPSQKGDGEKGQDGSEVGVELSGNLFKHPGTNVLKVLARAEAVTLLRGSRMYGGNSGGI